MLFYFIAHETTPLRACWNYGYVVVWWRQALFEIYNRTQCVRQVISRVARSTTAVRDICGCSAPCDEISYDVSYSLSRWPAESFDGDEAYIDIFQAILQFILYYILYTRTESTALVASGCQNQVQTLLADALDSHRSSTAVPTRHCSVNNYQQSQTSEIVRNNGLRQANDENEVRSPVHWVVCIVLLALLDKL